MNANRSDRTRSHAERLASRDGYFAPESVIRRVGNTPVTPFLGGGTAVLLQVAHPLVAAGVAAHSSYDRDIWRRLVGTLRALYLITYGSKAEAERAADAVKAAHTRVNGRTDTRLGVFPAGTAYSAEDPELMLWVHATLVYASLVSYQRFEHALSDADQERYYRDMAVVAELFGTPSGVIPATLADMRAYFAAQIDGETISVTEPARTIAGAVLRARLPGTDAHPQPRTPARDDGAAPAAHPQRIRPPPARPCSARCSRRPATRCDSARGPSSASPLAYARRPGSCRPEPRSYGAVSWPRRITEKPPSSGSTPRRSTPRCGAWRRSWPATCRPRTCSRT